MASLVDSSAAAEPTPVDEPAPDAAAEAAPAAPAEAPASAGATSSAEARLAAGITRALRPSISRFEGETAALLEAQRTLLEHLGAIDTTLQRIDDGATPADRRDLENESAQKLRRSRERIGLIGATLARLQTRLAALETKLQPLDPPPA